MKTLFAFVRDEKGATAIEYGLIVGIMAVIIIAAFAIFGDAITATFTDIATAINPA